MLNDESELDIEIRKALRAVDVPVGAKEYLLLHLMSQEVALEEKTEQVTLGRRTWLNQWGLLASAVAIAFVCFLFWPGGTNARLDVLMARHIERIENDPIQWNEAVTLPGSLRSIMNQVVQLQPLGFADITPPGSLSHIHVYAFRNQDGKQLLMIDMAKPKVRQKFNGQLTPLNSNTGGWSCAAAEVQGRLVVLAVPGDRAILLKHLRNITVT
jgi:hypothetical protein